MDSISASSSASLIDLGTSLVNLGGIISTADALFALPCQSFSMAYVLQRVYNNEKLVVVVVVVDDWGRLV